MTAEDAIRAAVFADPTIAGLIGTRFFPHDTVPQAPMPGQLPLLSYQRVDTITSVNLDGSEPPESVRIQLNVLAATSLSARALAFQLRRLFRGGYSTNGVHLVRLAGHGELPRDTETKLFGMRIDLLATMGAAEAA